MSIAVSTPQALRDCDGFWVDSPEGRVGFIGEVWLGPGDEPKAFAVHTTEGRHGLLLSDDVLALSPEDETVVLRSGATLLELQPPRLGSDADGPAPITAFWATSGATLSLPNPSGGISGIARLRATRPRSVGPTLATERPIWATIAVLYLSLAVIVAVVIGLAFLIAWLIAGQAY
jgi:hypothetical protein